MLGEVGGAGLGVMIGAGRAGADRAGRAGADRMILLHRVNLAREGGDFGRLRPLMVMGTERRREKPQEVGRTRRAVEIKSVYKARNAKLVPDAAICEVVSGCGPQDPGGRRDPGGPRDPGRRDRLVSWVAEQQLELITTRQLNLVGLHSEAIARRCRNGQLHRVHLGVYLAGPRIWQPGGRELAAVLAVGDCAIVSHRSAAEIWGIAAAPGDAVEITLVARNRRSRDGIRVHRVATLPADERALHNGIPVTSPARTLLDFASQVRRDQRERAIAEAYALRLTDERTLRKVIARHPRRPGAVLLRAELDREGGPAFTRREGERRMLELIREAGLCTPLVNRKIAGYEADFVWPEQRLIVEVDGFQFHSHRRAFEHDRKRDAAHLLAGYRVIRITWRRLTEERVAVAVIIARALAL